MNNLVDSFEFSHAKNSVTKKFLWHLAFVWNMPNYYNQLKKVKMS